MNVERRKVIPSQSASNLFNRSNSWKPLARDSIDI